mmetsp:Transcript_25171/g.45353  ORF Transcript_25171/g.45353 Transcript_25171/m.45353 type:complete len:271 (+) Transcript_25171:423-1235(+)
MGCNCTITSAADSNRQVTFFVPGHNFCLFIHPHGSWKMIRHVGIQTLLCRRKVGTHGCPQSRRVIVSLRQGKLSPISRTRSWPLLKIFHGLLDTRIILRQQFQLDLLQIAMQRPGLRSESPSRVPLVVGNVIRILPRISHGGIHLGHLHGRLRSRTGMAKLVHQLGVLVRNSQLSVGTGHLFESAVVVGFVEDKLAKFFVFVVSELVLEEGGEPSVPGHHGLIIGGGRGGGFGDGGAEFGAADGLGGDVGGVLFESAVAAEDEGGSYHFE